MTEYKKAFWDETIEHTSEEEKDYILKLLTSKDKKDIERQMWDDFHELTAKYYYYINAYENMTKAGLPPCFTPRIDAKYIKCLADGIEQALGAIVTATKDLTERSGIDGEQRGQG